VYICECGKGYIPFATEFIRLAAISVDANTSEEINFLVFLSMQDAIRAKLYAIGLIIYAIRIAFRSNYGEIIAIDFGID